VPLSRLSLDLPPQAVDRQHFGSWELPLRQQRGQDQVFRRDQAARVEFGLLTTGMLRQGFVLQLCHGQTTGQRSSADRAPREVVGPANRWRTTEARIRTRGRSQPRFAQRPWRPVPADPAAPSGRGARSPAPTAPDVAQRTALPRRPECRIRAPPWFIFNSPLLVNWMAGPVTAGAITSARATIIMTP
jgi:hypothetical protein